MLEDFSRGCTVAYLVWFIIRTVSKSCSVRNAQATKLFVRKLKVKKKKREKAGREEKRHREKEESERI